MKNIIYLGLVALSQACFPLHHCRDVSYEYDERIHPKKGNGAVFVVDGISQYKGDLVIDEDDMKIFCEGDTLHILTADKFVKQWPVRNE